MSVESFTDFYREHSNAVLAVARRRLADPGSAEDVTAEAFAIAWAHQRDGGELTLSWLYQVLRHVIGSEYRRAARAATLTDRIRPLTPDDATEDACEHKVDLRPRLLDLGDLDRHVLVLAYWADLPTDEIATVCGCSPTAARLRLMRARRRLRASLDALPTPPAEGRRDPPSPAPP